MNFKAVLSAMGAAYQTNKAGIKAGLAIASVPLVAGVSADAGIKTHVELEKMRYEEKVPDLKEKAVRIIPIWVKPVLLTFGTMGLIYSSHADSMAMLAALGAGYTLKDNAYKDLSEKVEEIAGKKKKEDIEEAIRIDKVQNNPPVEGKIIKTGHGDTLCYDAITGDYFEASKDFVDNAFLRINNDIAFEGYASWGDLLYQMNRLPKDADGVFDEPKQYGYLGWCDNVGVGYSSTLTEGGTPVLVVDYDIPCPNFAFYEDKSQK